MDFKSKYDIGQKVWHVRKISTIHKETCKTCNGQKEQTITWLGSAAEKKTISCPSCNGSGTGWNAEYRIVEKKITHIGIVRDIEIRTPGENFFRKQQPVDFRYGLSIEWKADKDDNSNVWYEENLFASENEALLNCTAPVKEMYDPQNPWSYRD